MTEKAFTPVSIRHRSAAQECADAHTASAERAAVSSIESALDLGEISAFGGYWGANKTAVKCVIKPL